MTSRQTLFEKLESRRRELGLSQSALAERSGVSLPTVHRILAGHSPAASFDNTLAIAQALGMQLDAVPLLKTQELLEQQARKKAEQLVRMVQGTSALEGQGVSGNQIAHMIRKTVRELLAGSRRRLWAE
jgi:transcriptional regulator with XRE-family HTH domain